MCEFCGNPNCPGSDAMAEVNNDDMVIGLRDQIKQLSIIKEDDVYLNLDKGCVVVSRSGKYKIRDLTRRLINRMEYILSQYGIRGVAISFAEDPDNLPDEERESVLNELWHDFIFSS